MTFELIADRRSDEVDCGSNKIVLHHRSMWARVDIAKIDRDFLRFRSASALFCTFEVHLFRPIGHPVAMKYVDVRMGMASTRSGNGWLAMMSLNPIEVRPMQAPGDRLA